MLEIKGSIEFDKDPLAVKQINYLTKIVNIYLVYELDAWPRNPTNNFKFKNCLFRGSNIVKTVIKKSICTVDKE